MKKKLLALVLALLVLLPLSLPVFAEGENAPLLKDAIYDLNLASEGVFLYNLETGTPLYEKSEDIRMYPASTTKIMTALVVLEMCPDPKNTTITVENTSTFQYIIDDGGVNMSLVKGETFTVYDLLLGLMMNSFCDVADLLAYHFGGGNVQNFIDKMNEKASLLGLKNTHFTNAHGLHDSDHYSSPRDIATFFMAALESETFREIISTRSYKIPATEKKGARTLSYTVKAFYESEGKGDNDYPFYRDYYVGGKSGFTDQAGRCLATLSEKDGVSYVCILLDADDLTTVYKETALLVDYAFENYEITTVYKEGDEVAKIPVPEAEIELPVLAPEDILVLSRKGVEPSYEISLPEKLTIEEVKDAAQVGSLAASFNGTTSELVPLILYLDENVPVTTKSAAQKEAEAVLDDVAGIFKEDKIFVTLLISLLVLIALCIPAMKITKILHKRNSHLPKH